MRFEKLEIQYYLYSYGTCNTSGTKIAKRVDLSRTTSTYNFIDKEIDGIYLETENFADQAAMKSEWIFFHPQPNGEVV